jgi:hypothetical protein
MMKPREPEAAMMETTEMRDAGAMPPASAKTRPAEVASADMGRTEVSAAAAEVSAAATEVSAATPTDVPAATPTTVPAAAATAVPAAATATAANLNHQIAGRRRRRQPRVDGRHRRCALDRHGRQREHRSRGQAQAADEARC